MMAKDNYLKLGTNGTDGVATGSFWNNTDPDDVAFTLNSSTNVNGNNESYMTTAGITSLECRDLDNSKAMVMQVDHTLY